MNFITLVAPTLVEMRSFGKEQYITTVPTIHIQHFFAEYLFIFCKMRFGSFKLKMFFEIFFDS